MKRRDVLATGALGLATGTAGCISDGSPTSTSDNGMEELDIAIESAEGEGDVTLTAEVLTDVSPDRHGEVQVSIQNEAEESRTFDCFPGSITPFHGEIFSQVHGDNSLWVRERGNPTVTEGCWVASGLLDDVCQIADVGPGEKIEGTVGIFGGKAPRDDERSSEPCMEPGTYEAERDFEVYQTASEPEIGEYVGDARIELELELSEN